jgi:carbon storage regulator
MLVLTRRIGEEIMIAGNIRVKVVAVDGQRIRLGITAPSSVPVVRRELLPGCSEGAWPPTAERNGTS